MTEPVRCRVECADIQTGSVIVQYVDLPLQITAAQRDHLEEATAALLAETGLNHAQVMVLLMEDIADTEAYQRVCERRGLLPL